MNISILLVTSEFRGDHAADVRIAHEVKPGETVEELVGRLIDSRNFADVIELRRVKP